MTAQLQARYSPSINNLPWNVALGVITIRGVDIASLQPALGLLAETVLSDAPGTRDEAIRRMKAFEAFFAANHCRSPLGPQLEALRRKEAPKSVGLVQALLFLEMRTGLLMGAQDAAEIHGELLFDLAVAGETFPGMRSEVKCLEGEPVLKDSEGIIASLFQGPDRRTRLKKETKDIVFFVFSVPGISVNDVEDGVKAVSSLFERSCAELHSHVYEGAAAR